MGDNFIVNMLTPLPDRQFTGEVVDLISGGQTLRLVTVPQLGDPRVIQPGDVNIDGYAGAVGCGWPGELFRTPTCSSGE